MNARTKKAQLHLAPEPTDNPFTEYNAGLQDLFSHAMDRALGVQKASFSAVVKMQNDVIEMQKQAFEAEPAINNVFGAASQAYATCLEIQLSWLEMVVNFTKQGAATWYQMASAGASLAGIPAPISEISSIEEEEEENTSYRAGAA